MAKIKTIGENGEEQEIEAFTPEEVAAQLKAKEAEFAAKEEALKKEKATLEDQVKNVKPDHPNFKSLKDALKAKEDELAATKAAVDAEKKAREEAAVEADIKRIAKGNVEMEKKIKLHLSNTLKGMPETTAEEKTAKLTAAIKLSADSAEEAKGMFDAGIGGGGPGAGAGAGEGAATVEFTAREKALGEKLGLTAADYKKYGPRLRK
jgi:multidrug efflux pump subunit AcrA (membrane-fusion protein)